MSDRLLKESDVIEVVTQYISCDYPTEEMAREDAEVLIGRTPSADRPQGEWVPFEYGDERWHKCTACGVADKYIEYVERPNGTTGKLVAIRNYCPNCGADMRKGTDDGNQ